MKDFTPDVDGDLLGEVAGRDSCRHFGDVPYLSGQVARHEVDVVGQILPGACDAGDLRLTAQLAFGADFARDARDFGGEGVELIHHRVDGVLELEDFALHIHRDLARQVATGDGRGHVGDVPDLGRQVVRHRVDAVGEVLPRAGDTHDVRLAAEAAFGPDLPGHTRDLAGERVELVDHRVDGVLDLQDFAAYVDRDFLTEIALGDGGRDLRHVT